MICDIRSDDIQVEDLNEQSLSMVAILAIQAFFEAIPLDVFQCFIVTNFQAAIGQTHWPLRHAVILLLYAMCPMDISSPKHYPMEILHFLSENMPNLLVCCHPDEVPHLVETSLFVLAMLLRSYPAILSCEDLCNDPSAAISQILNQIVINENTHPLIISRYCLILTFLASSWNEASRKSPLPSFLPRILGILRDILSQPLDSGISLELHAEASEALNQTILCAADHIHQTDELLALFSQVLDDLEASCGIINEDHVRYSLQAHLCSHLTSLTPSLRSNIPVSDVHCAVSLLFDILHQRDQLLYEEALIALAGFFFNIRTSFTSDHIRTMLVIIHCSLESESPCVINAASSLLGDIFLFNGRELADEFPRFFETEENLLKMHGDWPDIHTYLVKAISHMFEGVGKCWCNQMVVDPMKERLFYLLTLVTTASIDVAKEADIQYANDLFAHLAALHRIYAQLFYPTIRASNPTKEEIAAEKAVLNQVCTFAGLLVRVRVVNSSGLTQFIAMIIEYARHCSRRHNLMINRTAIHLVLEMALEGHRETILTKAAEEALARLREV